MYDKDFVAQRGLAHQRMAPAWDFSIPILDGTETVRAAGTKYLPRYPAESQEDYNVRLSRATFTNFFLLTLKHLVGKAFARPLVLRDDVPPRLVEWAEDVDLQGTHINEFAARAFFRALAMGLVGIMVDYPVGAEWTSLAEERNAGLRPYMALVDGPDILGVRTTPPVGDLEQVRILERTIEPDGMYGEREVERVRVLYPGGFALYEPTDKDDYVLVAEGPMRPLTEIPFVPVYGAKEGPWYGKSPLLDLAYKNIQYYQVDSDVDNAVRIACFPMLAISGWRADQDPTIKVAPNVVLATADAAGRFYYVEHSGAAIEAGRNRLEDIKADMAVMGLQMMTPRASGTDTTATETQKKYAESTSDLQRMAFGLKDALENALGFMAQWVGLPDGGSIELRGHFTLPRDAATEVQGLIALRTAGEITSKTLLEELKRRDFLPDDMDTEEELEALSIEGPSYAFD